MKSNVPVAGAIEDEAVLPERVREALGELVGAAREGLLALSVEVGLGVLGTFHLDQCNGTVVVSTTWSWPPVCPVGTRTKEIRTDEPETLTRR